ncbi:MAG: polysaccharide biosynthesis tyrosine autokinase, partial [Pedobacter sp.]
ISSAGRHASSVKAVQPGYGSTVLDVSIQTPVPERGVDILNRLFQVYNSADVLEKNQQSLQTMRFIDERLAVVEGQLDSVNENIMDYKARESVTDLSGQAGMYFSTVKELDKRNTTLDLQTEILQGVQSYVNGKGSEPGTVPSLMMVSDPILSNLLNQLYLAEFELDKNKSIAGDQSETIKLAEEKISRIKGDLRENMSNIRMNLDTERASNNAEIAKNNALLLEVPEKERGLLEISRQQSIKNNIYNYLLQRREETALSASATSADMKVLQSPSAFGPISPIAKNFYLFGFIIGLMLFLLYVQIQEQFNNKVLFRAEIEKKTNVPVIAEIVQSPNKDNIAIRDGKRTVIAEQFRTLRTNLAFMGLNETNKTLLVTSSVSGEGKSFVAINLAISITLTGKKVALMEMDLRKPKLSLQLNVSKNPGISSYLVGKASIEEICKQTEFEGLFVVSAGPIPPNPTELIQLDKFREMMMELNARYDYVIIDTAPIGPVTDAQLLAPYVNTSVYV